MEKINDVIEKIADEIMPQYPDISWDDCREKVIEGIRAGAKWMAEQGISLTAYIRDRFDNGHLSLVMPNNMDDRYKVFSKDDKVIVQIRKKEEKS